jgi:hypothetical protein|tara:strand:- start:505 stop:732 length:228 start_codon:yes stop_codon:yes gene_type:complete
MNAFFRFILWFTLIPWVLYILRAPFVMWSDFEVRYGFLGLIGYIALWILAFWLMGPISIFLGLMHSFKWVANGEA